MPAWRDAGVRCVELEYVTGKGVKKKGVKMGENSPYGEDREAVEG